jgi:hypothetical protein
MKCISLQRKIVLDHKKLNVAIGQSKLYLYKEAMGIAINKQLQFFLKNVKLFVR